MNNEDQGPSKTAKTSEKNTKEPKEDNLKHLHKNGRHYVRCKTCFSNPNVVKIFSRKAKLPAIAQGPGTIYRKSVVSDHLNSEIHREAKKTKRLLSLKGPEKLHMTSLTPIGRALSIADAQLAAKVASLFFHVYHGAKRLTLSANSFPSRVVVSRIANAFSFDYWSINDMPNDLQYLSPNAHSEFLKCIVKIDRNSLASKMSNSLAISLRCDGSVDRTQIDKIYLMAKAISRDGKENNIFLGAGEPKERGAVGVHKAMLSACSATLGENTEGEEEALLTQSKKVFQRASSFVTDGASVNTGEKNGLWALIDRDFNLPLGDEGPTPMIKIWCAAHRSQLAWKSVTNSIQEVSHLIQQLSSISTFFHASGIRTRELIDAANAEGCCVLSLPRVFEVRWTEFTSSLIEVVLRPWRALVTYFKKSNEKEAAGFLSFLTKKNNLDLLTFIADLLSVFSRYQQQLQSDSSTLIDMDRSTSNVKAKVLGLKETALLGGWVEALSEQVSEEEDGTVSLKGVELSS
ncbi:E3 SUMO- ligase KIAA1586-like isoform X4 [Paramuricea clavata]|uniref:E3 SUMO- ligase KIAA1586-like isoform X4 n=1 Tax=Paramuricea clavata TaxID=317549 RepID=A0A6S7K2J3_PARCT|nr:E3 SUMO- ligase KIAA1586-like isoform X4 [Paramuricea clavata]